VFATSLILEYSLPESSRVFELPLNVRANVDPTICASPEVIRLSADGLRSAEVRFSSAIEREFNLLETQTSGPWLSATVSEARSSTLDGRIAEAVVVVEFHPNRIPADDPYVQDQDWVRVRTTSRVEPYLELPVRIEKKP
jgi:hypothetical protein